MAIKDCGRFLWAIWQDWVAWMSGGVAVLLTLLGAMNHVWWLLAGVCILISSFRVWQVEHRKAEAADRKVVALVEGKPRIVYVGQRGSPLCWEDKSYGFYMLQLHFKNRPLRRVGEESVARSVSATIEFWDRRADKLVSILSCEGRWPVTQAGEHVGYEETMRTVDFEANENPLKLNLAHVPLKDGRVYAAAEENFLAHKAGDHPAYRIYPFQDTDVVRVCINLRGSSIGQTFWFDLKWNKKIDPQSGHRCLEVTLIRGENDLDTRYL
jgi:hypothetical protein